MRICSIEGCDAKHHSRDLCCKHYMAAWHRGDLLPLPRPTADERFDEKVEFIPFSECALWSGCCDTHGYGLFRLGSKMVSTHRFQWQRHHGPVPDGLHVLHKCHNGALGCVSIDHLKLGTAADNMRDKVLADRQARGSRSAAAKLTEADIPIIRRLLVEGKTQAAIAEQFCVHPTTITYISTGTTWRHVE